MDSVSEHENSGPQDLPTEIDIPTLIAQECTNQYKDLLERIEQEKAARTDLESRVSAIVSRLESVEGSISSQLLPAVSFAEAPDPPAVAPQPVNPSVDLGERLAEAETRLGVLESNVPSHSTSLRYTKSTPVRRDDELAPPRVVFGKQAMQLSHSGSDNGGGEVENEEDDDVAYIMSSGAEEESNASDDDGLVDDIQEESKTTEDILFDRITARILEPQRLERIHDEITRTLIQEHQSTLDEQQGEEPPTYDLSSELDRLDILAKLHCRFSEWLRHEVTNVKDEGEIMSATQALLSMEHAENKQVTFGDNQQVHFDGLPRVAYLEREADSTFSGNRRRRKRRVKKRGVKRRDGDDDDVPMDEGLARRLRRQDTLAQLRKKKGEEEKEEEEEEEEEEEKEEEEGEEEEEDEDVPLNHALAHRLMRQDTLARLVPMKTTKEKKSVKMVQHVSIQEPDDDKHVRIDTTPHQVFIPSDSHVTADTVSSNDGVGIGVGIGVEDNDDIGDDEGDVPIDSSWEKHLRYSRLSPHSSPHRRNDTIARAVASRGLARLQDDEDGSDGSEEDVPYDPALAKRLMRQDTIAQLHSRRLGDNKDSIDSDSLSSDSDTRARAVQFVDKSKVSVTIAESHDDAVDPAVDSPVDPAVDSPMDPAVDAPMDPAGTLTLNDITIIVRTVATALVDELRSEVKEMMRDGIDRVGMVEKGLEEAASRIDGVGVAMDAAATGLRADIDAANITVSMLGDRCGKLEQTAEANDDMAVRVKTVISTVTDAVVACRDEATNATKLAIETQGQHAAMWKEVKEASAHARVLEDASDALLSELQNVSSSVDAVRTWVLGEIGVIKDTVSHNDAAPTSPVALLARSADRLRVLEMKEATRAAQLRQLIDDSGIVDEVELAVRGVLKDVGVSVPISRVSAGIYLVDGMGNIAVTLDKGVPVTVVDGRTVPLRALVHKRFGQ